MEQELVGINADAVVSMEESVAVFELGGRES